MAGKASARSKAPSAGYSGTPLPKKLGIKEGHQVAILGAPAELPEGLTPLPDGVKLTRRLPPAPRARSGAGLDVTGLDVIVLFARHLADLPAAFRAATRQLDPAGGLWVAWPKRASGVATDITEDRVREVALAAGLVDNKVCAIDGVWSGLRCVYRLKDRPQR